MVDSVNPPRDSKIEIDPSGPAKRHRVSRACLQCRNRKIKCNGQEPTCGSCSSSGIKCEYSESKKRGLPPGYLQQLESYVKRMEQMLGAYIFTTSHGEQELISILDGLAEVQHMSDRPKDEMDKIWQDSNVYKKLKYNLSDSDKIDNKRRLSTTPTGIMGSNSNSSITAITGNDNNSADRKSDEDLEPGSGSIAPLNHLTNTDNSSSKLEPHSGNESTSSSGLFLGISSGFSPEFRPDLPNKPTINSSSLFLMGTNNLMKTGLDSMPLTDRISLLDNYFSYVHSWLPMVNKVQLIRAAYSMESFSGSDREMLLWATLEFASHVSKKERDLNTFRIQTQKFISEAALGPGSLEKVQALLIISLLFVAKGFWDSSWTTVGIAVRVAIQLGIHVFNAKSTVFSKRTWYACCIIETLVAARLGRCPHVSDSDFEVDPLEEDGWEEWELWKPIQAPYASLTQNASGAGKSSSSASSSLFKAKTESWSAEPARSLSVFNALLPLVRLLNNLISQVNQPSFSVRPRVQRSLFYNDLTSKLQLWSRNLPEHCSLSDLSMKVTEAIAPHKINLYLTFATTASLFYVTDEFSNNTSNYFFSQDTLPSITSQLLLNFGMAFSPNQASPFFEYFCSIPLLLALKTNSIRKVIYPINNEDDDNDGTTENVIVPLAFLEESWPGVTSLSLQYFNKDRFPILGKGVFSNSTIHDKKQADSSMHLTNALQAFAAAASLEAGMTSGVSRIIPSVARNNGSGQSPAAGGKQRD